MDFSGAATLGTDPELHALKAAGARAADALNLAVASKACFGRWMAFSLEDGSSPDHNTIYDTRADAIRLTANLPVRCHYEMIRPASYSPDEMALTLQYARAMHLSGFRAEGAPAPIMPVRLEDRQQKLRQLTRHARRNHR